MQLSPRELEKHRQEQNLFKLIDLFKTTVGQIQDEEMNLFWGLITGLESKEINEKNIHTHPLVDPAFLALLLIETGASHPFHQNISSCLFLLPSFVKEAYSNWKVAQDPETKGEVSGKVSSDYTKYTHEIKGRVIVVRGNFDQVFITQYLSLCESNGLEAPKFQRQPRSLSITVQSVEQVDTYILLFDNLLEETRQPTQGSEVSFQDFVLM